MCNECGFVTYPTRVSQDFDLNKYYETSYRPAPTVNNYYTCQRKNNYHSYFLGGLLSELEKKKGKEAKIIDYGAAGGESFRVFKQFAPSAQLFGSELTKTFIRAAYHEHGVDMWKNQEEITKDKFDLICCYHTLEHIPQPRQELMKLREMLSDAL